MAVSQGHPRQAGQDSNLEPADLESAALPIELPACTFKRFRKLTWFPDARYAYDIADNICEAPGDLDRCSDSSVLCNSAPCILCMPT